MVKREIEEDAINNNDAHQKSKLSLTDSPTHRPQDTVDDDMGEFEDVYEDDMDEDDDEIIVDANDQDDDAMMQMEQDETPAVDETQVWLPGGPVAEDEKLDYDPSAYVLFHEMTVEWPCLSFDMLSTNDPQANANKLPASVYMCAGTQADQAHLNKIVLMKASRLHKTKESEESEDDSDDDDALDEDPILEHKTIAHQGGVNRIRAMPSPSNFTKYIASWSENGSVFIWDVEQHLRSLSNPSQGIIAQPKPKPAFTLTLHRQEGFAIDWSSVKPGRLLTGSCNSTIYMTQQNEASWTVDRQPFQSHKGSVEDLQWSPTEENVFASCGVDGTVKIWDIRMKKKSALSINAHSTDVNVISWNKNVSYLIASGSDCGMFSVWDARTFSSSGTDIQASASFQWHKAPITSLEWHPTDESVLAVSGADDQVTLWDFSVEQDREEMAVGAKNVVDLPPQLMFIHQGQQHVKEVHWNKSVEGMLISTAESGFNLFKTISI